MEKFEKLVEEFKKLNLSDNEYIIYGSGALAVRGIRDVRDLDVFVTDKLYQKLEKIYLKNKKEEKIKIGEIEIYPSRTWEWESDVGKLEDVIERGEVINGIRFILLEDLITCKKKMGRCKDFKDIKLIENYLKK